MSARRYVPAAYARLRASARWLAAWIAVLAALASVGATLGANPRRAIDLGVYLQASRRFVAGEPLYRASDGALPFKYAPPAAAFFAPLASLPRTTAAVAWNLGSIAALAAVARWLVRAGNGARGSAETDPATRSNLDSPSWRAPALAAICIAHPLYLELRYAQVDLAMLGLLVGSARAAETRRWAVSGLALAVAAALKPPALLLLLVFFALRQFRPILWFGLWQLPLWTPVLARYGLDGTTSEIRTWWSLLAATTAPWVLGLNSQGLVTLLLDLTHPHEAAPSPGAMAGAQLLATFLYVGAVALARPSREVVFGVACLGVALLSPLAWRANFVLAFPLLTWSLASPNRGARGVAAVTAIVGAVASELVLGAELFRVLLFLRPFTWAFLALLAYALWADRGRWSELSAPAALAEASPSPQMK
jgi:Glycosyltransferase family 87